MPSQAICSTGPAHELRYSARIRTIREPDETLDQVIQALEALHTDHRVVGVVTHLVHFAERMPAHVRVKKAPEGSWIEVER